VTITIITLGPSEPICIKQARRSPGIIRPDPMPPWEWRRL